MEILKLTSQNIHDQHICCGFSDKKITEGYQKKKEWLKSQFKNGYTFKKIDVRGKVFIEYVPIEESWLPLEGGNYMVIHCFWVSGQFKNKGFGKKLLKECIDDAKAAGMDGVVAISSDKKRPFMSDPKFFKKQGFLIIDEAEPYFKLWALKLNEKPEVPSIKETAKKGSCPNKNGITVYYSNTCPFADYYINKHLTEYAKTKDVPLQVYHLKTKKEAQKTPIPWVINSVFYQGELVTLEMKPDRHLDKLIYKI